MVAEIGAAFLCADLGITPETREDHAAYVASWLYRPVRRSATRSKNSDLFCNAPEGVAEAFYARKIVF
jgi:antirestriction protein ArdC